MSSFKHNPYQQFSPPQPSSVLPSSSTTRRTALQQTQQHDLLQHTANAAAASAPGQHVVQPARAPQHSSPSGSTSVSPPSTGNSFVLSRDVSSVSGGAGRGEGEGSLPTALLSPTSVSSPLQPIRAAYPQPLANRSLPLSTVQPVAPGSANTATPPLTQTGALRPQNEVTSNAHPGPSMPTLTASYADSMWTGESSMSGDSVGRYQGVPMETTTAAASAVAGGAQVVPSPTDTLATTLFIDGLPPSIENQHQLSPYVPPQGRVKVRVKRSRGRDVGFAVYDSVDAASAALAWFHNLRMIQEMVQTSSYAVPSVTTALPVSYDDFVATHRSPADYARLLRHSISLRVEWAHTHEIHRASIPPKSPQNSGAALTTSESNTTYNLGSRGVLEDSMQPCALAPVFASQDSLVRGPQPPPQPSAYGGTQRLFAEEHASNIAPLPYTANRSQSTGRVTQANINTTYPPSTRAALSCNASTPPNSFAFCERQVTESAQEYAPYSAPASTVSRVSSALPYTTATTTVTAAAASSTTQLSDWSAASYPSIGQPWQPQPGRAAQICVERRLPSRTLFVKLIHNFPLPLSLAQLSLPAEQQQSQQQQQRLYDPHPCGADPVLSGGPPVAASPAHSLDMSTAMTVEDRAFFALAQRVCREEFFSEQFAGFVRYRPFLHPPYYGGCFVLFERDTDMQRCLQWMRGDARLMTLFTVQPARNDTFER
jgi:hypothetical protein